MFILMMIDMQLLSIYIYIVVKVLKLYVVLYSYDLIFIVRESIEKIKGFFKANMLLWKTNYSVAKLINNYGWGMFYTYFVFDSLWYNKNVYRLLMVFIKGYFVLTLYTHPYYIEFADLKTWIFKLLWYIFEKVLRGSFHLLC